MRKLGIIEVADNDINEVSGGTAPASLHLPQYDELSETSLCG